MIFFKNIPYRTPILQFYIYCFRYLYCDEIDLDEDSVLPILYASKKYMLPALTTKCVQYLEANLNPENICLYYEHSILYDIDTLKKRCETFIQTRTNDVIQSPAFLEVPRSSVKRILQFRKLAADELLLFQVCNSWAKEECARKDLEPSMDNRRQVLGDILYLLHLPSLPLKDFANIVSPAELLTAEEKCVIYDYIASDDTSELVDKLKFPYRRRSKPKPSVLRRFPNFSKCNVYSGDCNILKVQCDHDIILKGISVSGSLNHDPLTEVQIVIKQERTVLANRSVAVCDDRSGEPIQIALPDTVVLRPGSWYTIIATYHFFGDTDQGCCKRGKGGAKMTSCDGVTFEFDRADAAGHVIDLLFWKH